MCVSRVPFPVLRLPASRGSTCSSVPDCSARFSTELTPASGSAPPSAPCLGSAVLPPSAERPLCPPVCVLGAIGSDHGLLRTHVRPQHGPCGEVGTSRHTCSSLSPQTQERLHRCSRAPSPEQATVPVVTTPVTTQGQWPLHLQDPCPGFFFKIIVTPIQLF